MRSNKEIDYLSSKAKHKESTKENETGSREEEAKVEGTIIGGVSDHTNLLLPRFMDEVCKRLFPGVHLDHFHPIDNLVHKSDATICLASSANPQFSKLFPNPGLERNSHHQQHHPLDRMCGETDDKRPTTSELGPIL